MKRASALTIGLAEALIRSVGPMAADECGGLLAIPLDAWDGAMLLTFVSQLRRRTGDAFIGLGASPCPAAVAPLVLDLAVRCGTLREAFSLAFRLMDVATDALRFRLADDGSDAALEIWITPTNRDPGHFLPDWYMIAMHRFAQWLIGVEIRLLAAEFPHPMVHSYSTYAGVLGASCRFNTACARLVLPPSCLDARIIRNAADGTRLREETPVEFADLTVLSRTWSALVRQVLRAEIMSGVAPSTIEDIAEDLRVSAQTLRRRLKCEGTSYRRLKADIRQEFALDALAEEGATLAEASIRAGFTESNALARALRNGAGVNAAQMRDQVRRWQARKALDVR